MHCRSLTHSQFLCGFLAINLLVGIASGVLQITIPLYALALKANVMQLGLISGIGGIGRMLIILPAGLLADRYGSRKLFIWSTLSNAVLMFLLILANSPNQLMLVMSLQGMAQSVSFMSLQAGFLKLLPDLNLNQTGWQRGATSLGFLVFGPVLGAYFIQAQQFAGSFLITGFLLLLSSSLACFVKRVKVKQVPNVTHSLFQGQFGQLKTMLNNTLLLQIMLTECLGSASFMIYRTFIVPVAENNLHLPVMMASGLIVSQGIVTMLVVLGGGGLLERFSFSSLLLGSSLLIGLGMGMLAETTNVSVFWTGAIIFGVGSGLLSLSNLAGISAVDGAKGKIASLVSFSTSLGNTVGPFAGGCIGEVVGMQTAIWTPASAFMLLSTYLISNRWRQKKAQEKHHLPLLSPRDFGKAAVSQDKHRNFL